MLSTVEQTTTPRFMATLDAGAGEAAGKVRIPLAVTGTWVRGRSKFSITPRRPGIDCAQLSRAAERRNQRGLRPRQRNAGSRRRRPHPFRRTHCGDRSAGKHDSAAALILWGWFEPTERARTLVRNSEYRYISPAIDWGAKNKRTGKPQGATLTSVALTNRPFLEEMPQIRLSDPGYRLVDGGRQNPPMPAPATAPNLQEVP